MPCTQKFARSTFTNNIGAPGRYLGFSNNFDLLFRTNALNRMKLNRNVTYAIAGFSQPRNGYLLLGNDAPLFTGGPNELYSNLGAFSLLHLNGNDGAFAQQFVHRSGMKTGVSLTENKDFTCFGLRPVGKPVGRNLVTNRIESVICLER